MSLAKIYEGFYALVKYQAFDGLLDLTKGPIGCSSIEGLTVYFNNTEGRLIVTLAQTFSVCRAVVGDECFTTMAKAFIAGYPSENKNLFSYGSQFPQFLDEIVELNEEFAQLGYLPSLALFEWDIHRCSITPKRCGFDFNGFSKVHPSRYSCLTFDLAPDVFLVKTLYPIASIWEYHQTENRSDTLHIQKQDTFYLIERPGFQAFHRELTSEHFQLLQNIKHRQTLSQIVFDTHGDCNPITEFIEKGWIDGYQYDE